MYKRIAIASLLVNIGLVGGFYIFVVLRIRDASQVQLTTDFFSDIATKELVFTASQRNSAQGQTVKIVYHPNSSWYVEILSVDGVPQHTITREFRERE